MKSEQLLLKDFLYQQQKILFNANQIYLPHDKTILSQKIALINELQKQNQLLQQNVALLQDRIQNLEQSIIPSLPSWQDATPAEIEDILTKYYNEELTIEQIPWKIGDRKIIQHNIQLSTGLYSSYFILTILDKEKLPTQPTYYLTNKRKCAFVIGVQCKGHVVGESHDTNLNLFPINGFSNSYNYNEDLNQINWNSPSAWNGTSYTDAQTLECFTNAYNNETLNGILAYKQPTDFTFSNDYTRTFIPILTPYVEPSAQTLAFFKMHQDDYTLYVIPSENANYGYNFIRTSYPYTSRINYAGRFFAEYNYDNVDYYCNNLFIFCL